MSQTKPFTTAHDAVLTSESAKAPRLKILDQTAALMLQNAPKYRLKPRLRMTQMEQPFEVFGIPGEAGDFIALDPRGTVSVISEEEHSRDWEAVSRKNKEVS